VQSPDNWVPSPANGKRPQVLCRRSTLAPSTPRHSDEIWISPPLVDHLRPLLERHSPGPLTNTRSMLPSSPIDHVETVTAQPRSITDPSSLPLLPRLRHLPVQTVTPEPQYVTQVPSLDSFLDNTQPTDETVTRLCAGCGNPLGGKRPQATTHGPACRQRAYRRRKAAARSQPQRDNGDRPQREHALLPHATTLA
jgi:hypothetical protein